MLLAGKMSSVLDYHFLCDMNADKDACGNIVNFYQNILSCMHLVKNTKPLFNYLLFEYINFENNFLDEIKKIKQDQD